MWPIYCELNRQTQCQTCDKWHPTAKGALQFSGEKDAVRASDKLSDWYNHPSYGLFPLLPRKRPTPCVYNGMALSAPRCHSKNVECFQSEAAVKQTFPCQLKCRLYQAGLSTAAFDWSCYSCYNEGEDGAISKIYCLIFQCLWFHLQQYSLWFLFFWMCFKVSKILLHCTVLFENPFKHHKFC